MKKWLRNLSILIVCLGGAAMGLRGQVCSYRHATTVNIPDFAGAGHNGAFYSFDVSPDGAQLAAKYDLDEEDGSISIWVGILDLQKGTSIRQVEIGKPEKRVEQHDPRYRGLIRYAGNGRGLIVQIGNDIQIFRASDLARESSISVDPASDLLGDIDDFALAGDGTRLALLLGDPTTVRVLDVSSGRQLGEWRVPYKISVLALSPDGALAALPAPSSPVHGVLPVEIVDATSGRPLSQLRSGYAYQSDWGSTSPIPVFLSPSELLLSPGGGTDATGHHAGNALKLFDWKTGGLLQDFPIPDSGITGIFGASANGRELATLSMPRNPASVRSDGAWWGRLSKSKMPEVLIFQLGETAPLCTIPKVSPAVGSPLIYSDFPLRVSADLKAVALFQRGEIAVWTHTK